MPKRISVIGSGFSGLSAASFLARKGYSVTILEKNQEIGGRARVWKQQGFTFDMGPSWYWMPDVFERYFSAFGHQVSDFYSLKRLEPSYSVFFSKDEVIHLPANLDGIYAVFEQYEKGAADKLRKFLKEAEYKYEVGMKELAFKPGHSISEFARWKVLKGILKLHLFSSLSSQVRKNFKHPHLIQLLEFPVLFLGAKPEKTPALYSLMNYADFNLGTWYPMGGMHKIVEAMASIAQKEGVEMITGQEVISMKVNQKIITTVNSQSSSFASDIVVASADYNHVDSHLLDKKYANYNEKYWNSRTLSPSSLIFYVGVNKKLKNLNHHNLFFDEDFALHASEIYDHPEWPSKPLFYVSAPSVTDPSVAPPGKENLFILIPVAPGLIDNETVRNKYFNMVIGRMEKITGQEFKHDILFHRSYAHNDFISDYHSFKGNAYGLANTLKQTAILKPKIRNKKIGNLFYTGQLTVPGPGVPPSLISGEIAAHQVIKYFPN